ncbi:uncharacterized protein LOC126967722 isoform X2 [Leptidea sinapis]|uniref:uncharacterized protein LOC126967722 isoform X2 n=1 Tax=Leptidea sinapis TaxID=189913 RepID=UPI002123C0A0|nr:uncharacterized protein LOC126967722 isoform X2 [Leptidea sinapis]
MSGILEDALIYSQWSGCPIDVLFHIFKYMEPESLAKCLHVNRAWRNACIYFCDHYNLWSGLVRNCLRSKGEQYRMRSTQNQGNLFLTSQLWNEVCSTERVVNKHFETLVVKSFNVYRDQLFVICENEVKIFDTETLSLQKILDIECENYQETKYLIVILYEESPKWRLHVKKRINCSCPRSIKSITRNLLHAKLYSVSETNCCLIDIHGNLWAFRDTCLGHVRFSGRYYGPIVRCITIHITKIFLFIDNGNVLFANSDTMQLLTLFHVNVPSEKRSIATIAFDRNTLVYETEKGIKPKMFEDKRHGMKVFALPDVSVATLHGDVLLVGTHSGINIRFTINQTKNLGRRKNGTSYKIRPGNENGVFESGTAFSSA